MKTILTLTSSDTSTDMVNYVQAADSNRLKEILKLERYVSGLGAGIFKATLETSVAAVQASGTLTFVSIANTNTIAINGITFTAKTSAASAYEFTIGASDTTAAAACAAAINASTDAAILNIVTATSALGVVTVTAYRGGLTGNAITLVGSANATASAARLAGGTDGTVVTYNFGT